MGRIPSTNAIGEGFNWNNKQLPSACPVKTSHDRSLQERTGIDLSEIRAYKLGKRRWSYNQVELILCNELDEEQLSVTQAFYSGTVPGELGESALMYNVHLSNGQTLLFELYLVYDSPKMLSTTDGVQVEWKMISRRLCQRGCSGHILRSIQRLGRLGKRSWGGDPSLDVTDRTQQNMKDTRYMYISFDEAGTHVGCRYFRLIGAAFDSSSGNFLASAVSPPIRVLSNNDVPTGAAQIQIFLSLPPSWSGWEACIINMSEPRFPLQKDRPVNKRARKSAISNRSSVETSLEDDVEDAADFSSANHLEYVEKDFGVNWELHDNEVEKYISDAVPLATNEHHSVGQSISVGGVNPQLVLEQESEKIVYVPDFEQGFRLVQKSDHRTPVMMAEPLLHVGSPNLACEDEVDLEQRILDAISIPAHHFHDPSHSNSAVTKARLDDGPLSAFEDIFSRSEAEPPIVDLPEDREGHSGLLQGLYGLQYDVNASDSLPSAEPTGFVPVVRYDYKGQQLQAERLAIDLLWERIHDGRHVRDMEGTGTGTGTAHIPVPEPEPALPYF